MVLLSSDSRGSNPGVNPNTTPMARREGSRASSLGPHIMRVTNSTVSKIAAPKNPIPTSTPMAQDAQMDAAVVRPLMFRPSFMMTPAPRKPTPVTMPWMTRDGSIGTAECMLPPHQNPG